MHWPTPAKRSQHPMALLGIKISWASRAMPGQSQTTRGSDQGMKNLGSPPSTEILPSGFDLSRPQNLGPRCSAGPVSFSRRWHLEDPKEA